MANGSELKNLNVVFFESRLSQTMADLIELNGGNPFPAPALKEVPLENNLQAFVFAEKLFRKEISLIILLTGVGTRALVGALETRYKKEEIIAAFKACQIVPRGPKPIRVLRELEIPFSLTVPEPNTWKELLRVLDENQQIIPIKGRCVAVQEYGVSNPELLDGLRKRGADLLVVPVYRWTLPDNLEPLKNAVKNIVAGKMQLALFTTAVQVDHLFKVAGSLGLAEALKKALARIVVASVGPDCTQALVSFGLQADIQPESPKMGPLVMKAAEHAKKILEEKNRIH